MFELSLSNYQISILILFSIASSIILGLSKTAVLVEQEFFEQDLALSYSFNGDTISTTNLWVINFIMLFITFSLVVFFKYKSPEQLIIIGFFIFNSIIIVDAVTEYLKRGIGEPRPCAFYLCDYAGFAKAVNSGNYTNYYSETTFGKVGDFSKCGDIDGFMSWPSGHASTSFASMLIASILLHYTFEFQEPILNIISYFPLIISIYISVSRVQDNKHHSYDVFSGVVIGCVITLFMWLLVKLMLKKLDKKEDKGSELKQTTTNNYYEF